jgi:glycerophosphoryl diester phosphodiesterase
MSTCFPFLNAGPMLAFAHRGGAGHPDLIGLENTRAAFAHAVGLGYRYLETDVHVTRDGVLVAFHDALLERVTDGAGSLDKWGSEALAEVRVAGREPVPTLASLVAAFPDACFNIDLKADGAVAPLAALVDDQDLQDRVLVGSFSGRRLRRFRRLAGHRVATSASPGEVAAYLLLPVRLARLLTRGRPAALQVPYRLGPIVVASRRLVRRAHAGGLQVHVWTVDDPSTMTTLLDRGVDGLMTDRTEVLRDVLRRRDLWRAPDQERSGR